MRKSVVYRFFMGDLLELKVKRGKEKGGVQWKVKS
jgi:hypothetical protein